MTRPLQKRNSTSKGELIFNETLFILLGILFYLFLLLCKVSFEYQKIQCLPKLTRYSLL